MLGPNLVRDDLLTCRTPTNVKKCHDATESIGRELGNLGGDTVVIATSHRGGGSMYNICYSAGKRGGFFLSFLSATTQSTCEAKTCGELG